MQLCNDSFLIVRRKGRDKILYPVRRTLLAFRTSRCDNNLNQQQVIHMLFPLRSKVCTVFFQ